MSSFSVNGADRVTPCRVIFAKRKAAHKARECFLHGIMSVVFGGNDETRKSDVGARVTAAVCLRASG